VAALLTIPGFTSLDVVEPPAGYARVVAPEGCDATSYGGVTYEVDAHGTAIVPAAAVAELLSHGFTASEVVEGVELAPAAARASETEG